MGREYNITYTGKTGLSQNDLDLIKHALEDFENSTHKITFLKSESENLIFGFKIKSIPAHNWIWDGNIYINENELTLQFHTGTTWEIDAFYETLKSIFHALQIDISATEEDD